MDNMTEEQAYKTLLTLDGKGVKAKLEALGALRRIWEQAKANDEAFNASMRGSIVDVDN